MHTRGSSIILATLAVVREVDSSKHSEGSDVATLRRCD